MGGKRTRELLREKDAEIAALKRKLALAAGAKAEEDTEALPAGSRECPVVISDSDSDTDSESAPPVKRRASSPPLSRALAAAGRAQQSDLTTDEVAVKKSEPMSAAEARAAVEHLFNPKAEVKKEMLLGDAEVLALIGADSLAPLAVTLDEGIRDVAVSRAFLSKRYGGGEQDTFPKPDKTKAPFKRHGYDNFMCINLLYNPHGPSRPGCPGLYFETRSVEEEAWQRESQMLFVRLGANRWLYLGEYRVSPAPALSKEQWRAQGESVRKKWSKEIHTRDWGRIVRARIHLRRVRGREPTVAEISEALGSAVKYENIDAKRILQAFDEGEEVMGVWCMQCIGYDEKFQRELVEAHEDFVPRKVKPRTVKKTAAGLGRVKRKTAKNGRAIKRS